MARHDYFPFGEEIAAGAAGRDASFDPASVTDTRLKFTGQMRDEEAGQDFFHARYFTPALGRFNSVDPGNAGASLLSSESWNGYAYVSGNPLNSVDPSGMALVAPGDDPCYVYDAWCGGPGPVPPCFDCGGGSGGNGGGGGRVPNPPAQTSGGARLPPNSFPGGETLGLPPGLSVPWQFSLGTNPFVFSLCGQAPQACASPVVWDTVGEALLRYSPWVALAAIVFQPPPMTAERRWELTNIQNSKHGKQNVAHPYTMGKATEMFPDDEDCAALKRLMDWARKNGNSKLFNDAKATWKQYCRGQ